jgi:hypothetical protein
MKPTANKYLSSVLSLIVYILFFFPDVCFSQKKYPVTYFLEGKDSLYQLQQLDLKTDFSEKASAIKYINTLPALLFSKGFAAASVD